MSDPRAELRVQIARYIGGEPQPGIVACEFCDADGQVRTFIDKVSIFTAEQLDASSKYPRAASIECQVLAVWKDDRGRELVRVTTAKPCNVESTDGVSEFVVLSSQIVSH